jgi:hypothetical protein
MGIGRTEGLKLYRPTSPIPNQSPKSRGLASAVDRPTKRIGVAVWVEINRMRLTITSYNNTHREKRDTVEKHQMVGKTWDCK